MEREKLLNPTHIVFLLHYTTQNTKKNLKDKAHILYKIQK
jgi:hypothetical protein